MLIEDGKLINGIIKRSFESLGYLETPQVLPAGKWVHVAASYDHSTGNNSLFINDMLVFRETLTKVMRLKPPAREF